MNKYEINELEQIEHPYEIEYSSLKSSKNESLKVHANKLKEMNKIINNNNNIKINSQNNFVLRNSPNLNSINSFKSYTNNNSHHIKNFRLNENVKKNLLNHIKSNKAIFHNKKCLNKIQIKNKKFNKKDNNNNNINVYSKVNDYWENREKQNKIKMLKIKKEREQKIYGELYPKPKISKNTKEIIERLKERNYELTTEDELEEEINKNIPVKTKEKNYFFKTVYYSNKNKLKQKNKKQNNKSVSKINTIYKYNKLYQIQTSYRNRAKTPKLKKYITSKNKKATNKKKLNLSTTDIKNLEKIRQIRKKEEDEKIKEIEDKIKEEDEKQILLDNKENIVITEKEIIDNNKSNYLNKSQNIMSMRNNNLVLNYISNLNEIMTSRKYLNEIYNKDKKIINHSFILNSSTNPNTSSIKKISINRRNNFSSNNKKSKTFDSKKMTKVKRKNIPKSNKSKNFIEYGLYDPESRSYRYRHYTDISNSYYTNIKFDNNHINNVDEEKFDSDKIKDRKNNIIIKQDNIPSESKEENRNVKNINKLKNNLRFEFHREMLEKKDDINKIYKKELKQKTDEIHKIEIELKERDKINKQLINESNTNNSDFDKIIKKNEFLNNKFNEFDNESLLKYREENLIKLEEIRQRGNKCDKRILFNIKNEEEKNIDQSDKQDKIKINTMKYKAILNSAQQTIENNLELYNNELKINEQKKKAILNRMFGDNYQKNFIYKDIDEDLKNRSLKFCVNNNIIKNEKNRDKNNIIKYSSLYRDDEENKEKLNDINGNLLENFDFERNHHL